MTIIALYPQINLWIVRGSEWQGSYVLTQGDEITYSAYVNALIDGRPRKNDPFNGRDVVPGQPSYESLHSIQFVPAYAIALPAKAFGLTGSTAFICLIMIAAFASSLAIFWLLATLSGDSKLAAAGALLTLCFGALVGSDCCWQANAFTEMLPFLRRYQPAAVFPLFFVFCVFVWRALTREGSRAPMINSLAAGTLLSVMVFSYFYIWTAALAWFVCVGILWILFRRDQFRRIALSIVVIGVFTITSILAFLAMFSNRNPITDQGQLMVSTRAPDLFNQPEIIALITLAVLGHAVWREVIDIHSPLVLFTISLTLLPFAVFNQQILTGMSLQPIHYRVFIANYVVLLSVVLVFLILWRTRYPKRTVSSLVLVVTTVAALGWGMHEVSGAAERGAGKAKLRDDVCAVAKRITALAKEDGSVQAELNGNGQFPTVFTSTVDETLEVSQAIPSDSPAAVLWSLHSDSFIGGTESKERFYRHLYYSGLTPQMVGTLLRENKFWVVVPLFGSERIVEGLIHDFKPLTVDEIQAEVSRYTDFYNNFTREHAAHPTLNYVIVPNVPELPNFDNLDRWYERDTGEKVGAFTIHRVKLRP